MPVEKKMRVSLNIEKEGTIYVLSISEKGASITTGWGSMVEIDAQVGLEKLVQLILDNSEYVPFSKRNDVNKEITEESRKE